jgi:catechol 2,3-dioxygenase-like lactoylglutathione lyase family enzyme
MKNLTDVLARQLADPKERWTYRDKKQIDYLLVSKPLADGRPFVPFRQGLALTTGGPGGAPQIDHMAFRVSGVEALSVRLQAAGVKFFEPLHDGIYGRTIYVADPDGNKVELYEEPR